MRNILLFLSFLMATSAQAIDPDVYPLGTESPYVCIEDQNGPQIFKIGKDLKASTVNPKKLLAKTKRQIKRNKLLKEEAILNKNVFLAIKSILKNRSLKILKKGIAKCLNSELTSLNPLTDPNGLGEACQAIGGEVQLTNPLSRIVNGRRCYSGNSPIIKLIIIKTDGAGACTGVSLGQKKILTAAHCFKQRKKITSVMVISGTKYLKAKSWKIHSGYKTKGSKEKNREFDLAILHTRGQLSSQPATLLSSEDLIIGEDAIIAGYGNTGNGSVGKFNVGTLKIGDFDSEFLLTGSSGTTSSPCFGDSGGAIFVERDEVWQVAGILSGITTTGSGGTCTTDVRIAVYAHVASAINQAFIN